MVQHLPGTSQRYVREVDMCSAFRDLARRHGFAVHSETDGFDMLLVADRASGFSKGDQIGVHAKLHANFRVLAQCIPRDPARSGPDYYAVLVPSADSDFRVVAHALRIAVLEGGRIADPQARLFDGAAWHRHSACAPSWVPECEVHDLPAGGVAPKLMTPWKMAAVKLCLLAEQRGFLTERDFSEADMSMGLWRAKQWIKAAGSVVHGGRKVTRYVLVDERRPPHLLHPEIVTALSRS